MPEDQRRLDHEAADAAVLVVVHVGPAGADRRDLHQHLARARPGNRPFLQRHPAGAFQHRGPHRSPGHFPSLPAPTARLDVRSRPARPRAGARTGGPHQVRAQRCGASPPPGSRTGASCSAGRRRRTRTGTVPASLPRPAGRRGWPRTSPARRRRRGGRLAEVQPAPARLDPRCSRGTRVMDHDRWGVCPSASAAARVG